jgi:hypothetical protein
MTEHIDDRLDAMLAPLRDHQAQFDEIAQARVRVHLEAALAQIDAAAEVKAAQRWGRGRVTILAGVAAAAALLIIVAAREGSPRTDNSVGAGGPPRIQGPAATGGAADRSASDRVTGLTGNGVAGVADGAGYSRPPAVGRGAPGGSVTGPGDSGASKGAGRVTAPVTVAAGASAQLDVGDAAVTVYGPGRLSPVPDGAVVEAASLVVDRVQGDAPWSVRFHGVKIVAMRATFAAAHRTEVRVTVMRGEIVLICPSGTRTIRAGASGSCEPAAKRRVTTAARLDSSPAQPPAPDVPSSPAVVPADAYRQADAAMRGDLDAAHEALLAVIDTHPDSLDAASALLYLARMAAVRGDISSAFDYLARLDRHPRRAVLTMSATNLRVALARYANVQSLKP